MGPHAENSGDLTDTCSLNIAHSAAETWMELNSILNLSKYLNNTWPGLYVTDLNESIAVAVRLDNDFNFF